MCQAYGTCRSVAHSGVPGAPHVACTCCMCHSARPAAGVTKGYYVVLSAITQFRAAAARLPPLMPCLSHCADTASKAALVYCDVRHVTLYHSNIPSSKPVSDKILTVSETAARRRSFFGSTLGQISAHHSFKTVIALRLHSKPYRCAQSAGQLLLSNISSTATVLPGTQ